MKNFIRWLKEIYRWVQRVPITRHYWWTLGVVSVALFAVAASGWAEQVTRLVGMLLQLGGVLTVVWGILETRADFAQPTIRSQFKDWFKRFPLLYPPSRTVTVNGIFPAMIGKAEAYSTHGPASDQSIEGRMAHLESIVNELEMAQAQTRIAVRNAQEKAEQALEAHASQLASQIDVIARRIETTATGGIHISAAGVILLFVGTVFGGTAPDLCRWLTTCPG